MHTKITIMPGRVVIVLVAIVARMVIALPSRNLTNPNINPDCDKECDDPWIITTAAVVDNNTLYHLWGAKGALSFLVVADTGGPQLTVDWEALRNNSPASITFQRHPARTFGFVIPSLVLYNDAEDRGAFSSQNESIRVATSDFTWSAEVLPEDSHQVAVLLQTTHFNNTLLPNNTRLLIQVAAYGVDGRSTVLPHLLRTPDSAQMDFIFKDFNLNISQETEGWKQARWGMDVVVFSSEHEEDSSIKYSSQKSLDDEHTPGVFDLDQMTTKQSRDSGDGGYLQWRPVSYLSSDRDISLATIPNLNTSLLPLANLTDSLQSSLAYAVLGENLTLPGAAVTTVLSFGQSKDGFYRSKSYTTWTVALGDGAPPKETFSTLVITIISLGVALPAVMFLAGCLVLGVRRCRRNSETTLLITEHE